MLSSRSVGRGLVGAWVPWLASCLCLASASGAEAQVELKVVRVQEGRVRVDGALLEWRGIRSTTIGEGDDASMKFALAHDNGGLYLGAAVRDDRFVRTAARGTAEDAVILTLAMPKDGGGWAVSEVWLFAGIPGRQAARASLGHLGGRPKPASSMRVVEGPSRGDTPGYVLEAYIPWQSIPRGQAWRRALAAIRLRDVDNRAAPRVESEPASARVNPEKVHLLPPLRIEGQATPGDALKAFLRAHDLMGMRPRFSLRGDVDGDRRTDRVTVIGPFVVVVSAARQGAAGFTYARLPVFIGTDVIKAKLRDFTGDGAREVLLKYRQRTEGGSRELWQVMSAQGGMVKPIFTIQTSCRRPEGLIRQEVKVSRRKGDRLPSISVAPGGADGLGPHNFKSPRLADVEPMLLPWGEVEERVYKWNGERFAVASERKRTLDHGLGAGKKGSSGGRKDYSLVPVDSVLAEFRRSHGISERVPDRFRKRVNLAGDPRPETLTVVGTALVVAGPAFQGGAGYFYYGFPVAEPSHVLDVFTADITGDRREELFSRIRLFAGDVQREVLLAHQFVEGSFKQLLAVEVARCQGPNWIRNTARVLRRGKRGVLEVRPGRARGWSSDNYPFAADAPGAVQPLLVPWRDRAVRYRFDGDRLVR